jgi:hypothetical protein
MIRIRHPPTHAGDLAPGHSITTPTTPVHLAVVNLIHPVLQEIP